MKWFVIVIILAAAGWFGYPYVMPAGAESGNASGDGGADSGDDVSMMSWDDPMLSDGDASMNNTDNDGAFGDTNSQAASSLAEIESEWNALVAAGKDPTVDASSSELGALRLSHMYRDAYQPHNPVLQEQLRERFLKPLADRLFFSATR